MKGNIEERAVELAQYIIENRSTVRGGGGKVRNIQVDGTYGYMLIERFEQGEKVFDQITGAL